MLTPHQEDVLNQSLDILNEKKRLLIKGSAGVGKTFLVNSLLNYLPGIKYITAPTNKAVAVLRGKVDESDTRVFMSTHSALKLKRFINKRTGQEFFKPDYNPKYPPLENVRYLIIDEVSMLNRDLLEQVEVTANKMKVTCIFLGDDKQLPPVGEKTSPIFNAGFPTVELTEIVRQKGNNPIIDLSRNLDLLNSGTDTRNELGGYIFTGNKNKIIDTLAFANGTDDLKYLAYTNKVVDEVNRLVRVAIYGSPKIIEKGETIIFNKPFGEDFYTNQEVLVDESLERVKPFYYAESREKGQTKFRAFDVKYYSVNPETTKDGSRIFYTDKIIVPHEDSVYEIHKMTQSIAEKCKDGRLPWFEYYNFVEQFSDIKYNHAISVHKSQGSTFKQVIIDYNNINLNRNLEEKEKMLYTAVTRASDLVITYKK